MNFGEPLGKAFVLTLLLLTLLSPNIAQAQNSTPSQRVVAGCVGYGTGLADDMSGAGRNTPAWDNVFRPAREECLRRGGPENMPNGSMFAPFYLATGADNDGGNVICVSSETGKGQACWVEGNEGLVYACPLGAAIVNTAGLAICQAVPGVSVYVPGNGTAILQDIKPAMANFFGCAAASCLFAIANDNGGPRGGTGPAPGGKGGKFPAHVEEWKKQCTSSREWLHVSECLKYKCVSAGYIAEQCDEMAKRVVDSIIAAMAATLSTNGKKLLGYLKDLAGDIKEAIADHPVEATIGVLAIGTIVYICVQTAGACVIFAPEAEAGAAGLLALAGLKKVGGGSNATGNGKAGSGDQAAPNYCRNIIVAELRAKGAAQPPQLIDALTALCVAAMPGQASRQKLAAAMIAKCDLAGYNATRQAGPDAVETKYSRAVNQCLRLVAATVADFGRVPGERTNFANRMTGELQDCVERAGLQWQGSDLTGAAVPPPGGVRNGLGQLISCLRAWPASVP